MYINQPRRLEAEKTKEQLNKAPQQAHTQNSLELQWLAVSWTEIK
jgi:hypothetical protein